MMGFEPSPLLSRQRPVQVGGYELHQLVARHVRRSSHLPLAPPGAPSRYGSSAPGPRSSAVQEHSLIRLVNGEGVTDLFR